VEWLGLTSIGKQEHIAEIHAELEARQAALEEMKKRLDQFIDERELPDEVIALLRTRNESRLQLLPSNLTGGIQNARLSVNLKRELIDAERDFIFQLLRDGKITDEARRRIEYELDLEEASVANRAKDGGGWI
jgi:CPA1 family monovalent cation:H+ antiporter